MADGPRIPFWIRIALISTGILNIFGGVLFLPGAESLRTANGFPAGSHPLYLSIISSWIFLFGICYLWLGFRGGNERLFLVIGAAGKSAFVGLAFLFAAFGDIPVTTALSTIPDLVFAAIFVFYLVTSQKEPAG